MPTATAPVKRTIHHLLVVIDDPCTSPELCAEVRAHARSEDLDVLVVAPAHDTPSTQWYVDQDAARADAARRLRICAACLRDDGIRVETRLADADPVQAVKDALFDHEADEILLVTAEQPPSRWLRPSAVERARTLGIPLTHLVMPSRHGGGVR